MPDNTPMTVAPEMSSLARPANLPDFRKPPLSEVVLSVQFASIPTFRSVHVGLLWENFRREYPKVSEQAPLQATFETFGIMPANPAPFFQIETFLSPPMPRYWFEEQDGSELLQVQQDRIVHNWRKREGDQDYPRYEAIRSRFVSDVEKFTNFLTAEKLGELRPNQCEISYINTIEIPGNEEIYASLERVTPLWTKRFAEPYPHELENSTVQSRFVLRDKGKPYGRAYVTFAPAMLMTQNRPVIRLEITIRGKPRDESIAEAFRLLDDERQVVVRTFAAVTTPEMWDIWERIDEK